MLNHLTREQQDLILSAGAALRPADRRRLEERVLEQLATAPEIGDGLVFRTCREVQRQLLVPPTRTDVASEPRHGRP
jgi:hypothetical protein